MKLIKLKELLLKEQAMKSDVKKMEKMANDITIQMKKLNDTFKKAHKITTGDDVLYNNLKEWEELTRKVDMKYGGWFGFVYDSDYIK